MMKCTDVCPSCLLVLNVIYTFKNKNSIFESLLLKLLHKDCDTQCTSYSCGLDTVWCLCVKSPPTVAGNMWRFVENLEEQL